MATGGHVVKPFSAYLNEDPIFTTKEAYKLAQTLTKLGITEHNLIVELSTYATHHSGDAVRYEELETWYTPLRPWDK